MTRDKSDRQNSLPDEIKRQFGSPGTLRFMHSLPSFQITAELSDRFADLLAKIDRAERRQENSPRRQS